MKDPIFQPCAAWAEKLAAKHPDDLSQTEWAELEDHLAHCPACAAVRAEYRLMDERIRDYPARQALLNPPPPPLLIPHQVSGDDAGPPLSALDRIYRSSTSRHRLLWNMPFLSATSLMRGASIFIVMVVCLIASLILGIYFLHAGISGF